MSLISRILLIIVFCFNFSFAQTCQTAMRADLKADLEKKKKEIAKVDTSTSEGFKKRGTMKYNIGDFSGAVKDYTKSLEMNPNAKIVYYNRGSAKISLGDYYGAIDDFTNELNVNPDYALAYNNRAWAKAELKNYKAAIKDYNNAIRIDSKLAVAYCNRGIAKVLFGKKEDGCKDISKSGELGYEKAYEYIKTLCN